MKIVLAPDKFKSTMTSPEVCATMTQAIRDVLPDAEIVSLPMADGGDGTMRAMASALHAEIRTKTVCGPLGQTVTAEYAFLPETGILEMASASGIALVPREKLNPMIATTYGTGELIRALLDDGVKSITLGIGGSATVDGGTGMARALGFRFLDEAGQELAGIADMDRLSEIDASQADPRLKDVQIRVACDVTSPLLGKSGAVAVFAPQKGATPEMMVQLEKNLSRLAEVWIKQGVLASVSEPGDGAAGGLGAGLRAFCKAVPCSGARLIMELLDFEKHLAGADLVITGEGKTDSQTDAGKLCGEVAAAAHRAGVPVLLLSGSLGGSDLMPLMQTFDYVFSTSSGHTDLTTTLKYGQRDLYHSCRNIAKLLGRQS